MIKRFVLVFFCVQHWYGKLEYTRKLDGQNKRKLEIQVLCRRWLYCFSS